MIDGATFVDRQQKLRTAMAEAGIDLVAAYADVWRPGNVFYLTNWREPAGGISQAWCLFLLPTQGDSILLVGFETTLQAPDIAVMDRVERSDRLSVVLNDVRQKFHPRRVGLIGENLLPLATYRQLTAGLGDVTFVDAMPLLSRQRRVKSPQEIALMREAAALSDGAMEAAIATLREGTTEAEIAAVGNAFIMSQGATLSFYPTVGSGTNSARAMQLATDKPIRRGELVLLDFGAYHRGYYGDISRTVGFGDVDPSRRRILETAIAAGTEGLTAIKPGVMIKDVELTIRRVITEGGFGDFHLHNIGHGIGTDQEEDFPIGPESEIELMPGMTFTVEPGIYLPGVGGCRIEDVVVVTDTGVDVLSRVRRDYFLA
jgi:Xaa-Pro aminopeptidase